MKKYLLLVSLVVFNSSFSQKERFYVFTYKFKNNDKIRVSVSEYKNFSTVAGNYNNSLYQETSYDLYQDINYVDEDGIAESTMRFELTKNTINGQNMTYELANIFKNDNLVVSFDRYGKVKKAEYKNNKEEPNKKFEKLASQLAQIYIVLPDKPMKVGESWELPENTELLSVVEQFKIQKPQIFSKMTFSSADNNVATIKIKYEISGTGKLEKMVLNYLIQAEGKIYFDLTAGRLINGNILTQVVAESDNVKQKVEFNGSISSSFNVEK